MAKSVKRLNDIAFMKTAMMVIIVLYHCMLFFGGNWFTVVEPVYDGGYLYSIARWMNTFHIQTFAMASGFLYYYLKGKRQSDCLQNIKKRAKRLMVPYLFATVLWAAPIGWLFFHYSIKDLFFKYVLMTSPSQLWFLVMLFMVFVFFEIFGNRLKISLKNLIIVLILMTVIGQILMELHINYFQIAKAVQYILYFYLGGFLHRYGIKISKKQVIIMIIAAGVLYGASLIVGNSNAGLLHYLSAAILPVVSVLEVSSIYYICKKLLDKNILKTNSRMFKLLEENSFGIYIFHQQIIYFMIIWLNGVVHPIVQVLVSFVVAYGISLIMSWVLRKNKITRFMFGL